MSEGIQITIPDFDDDDYSSAPTPFGRSGGAFGFGGSFGGSALDSPTLTTPVAERNEQRSYFPSHSRMDSGASVESTGSATTRHASRPFAHSSQSSIATSSTAFSKKPSLASIRNAFKSGKSVSNDPPPVPSLDHHPYPILRNPFNRSTSSLNNHVSPVATRGPLSSPFPRPPTPGSVVRSLKAKTHSHGKSHHSQTGSVFHASDGGSDYGHSFSPSSPPPVPPVPNNFGAFYGSDTPPISDIEEDRVVIDPKTPADFALHAVFMRFATIAENKIDSYLRQNMEPDPLLSDFLGPGVDPKLDATLQALGKIAQKHAKSVLDSIMRWRRSQQENVGQDIIKLQTSQVSGSNRTFRLHDLPAILNGRKSLASMYVMCRALVAVLESISKDALGEAMGHELEDSTFDQFRKPDLKLLGQSANHRLNAELLAILLGHLSRLRFVSVTDRFLAELSPIAAGQIPKDLDSRYEHLLKGLKYIQIKVWPPETFEEGAEFMESLSMSFVNAHGLRLKTTFAETLTCILHPISKTAQAETNNPQWAKAIEVIYPKAREMMTKPRYWAVAFPLTITSLCVAPQGYFLKHWMQCYEAACSKLKEKSHRVMIMNGIVRLIWTYLYRCQETASTTTSKLDTLLKHFFPSNRTSIYPPEDHLEPLIYIVHFILTRHLDYGQDLCLELMQESAIKSLQQSSNIGGALAPERTFIAVQALLLSLHCMERDIFSPSWPSIADFMVVPTADDYPTSSEFLPASVLAKPGMKEFIDRIGSTLAAIAVHCGNAVGHMSVFDEQWAYARLNPVYDELHNFATRRHPDGRVVAYPQNLVSLVSLLQTCFQSWPRCLHPTFATTDAIDMLLRGVIHVEPSLAEVSRLALKRFMADRTYASTTLARFTSFLFGSSHASHDGSGLKLMVECSRLLDLWLGIVDGWAHGLLQRSKESLSEDQQLFSRLGEIEAGGLFLLTHESSPIHTTGVKVIRILQRIQEHISTPDQLKTSLLFVEHLHGEGIDRSYLSGYDELLDSSETARLEQWRQSKRADVALRIADSAHEKDRKLWRYVFPSFLRATCSQSGLAVMAFRDTIVAAVSRYHPTISHLAGLSTRVPPGLPARIPGQERDGNKLLKENKHLVDQWCMWVKVLCATAVLSESSRPALTHLGRDHTRAPSDSTFERERLSTTRGLFRYLTPFLDSEYTIFRDAAVLCISSLPHNAYPQLLEDLNLLAGRQFYDDPRGKSMPNSNEGEARARSTTVFTDRTRRQERLHSAVARIYYLTAHNLQLQRSAGKQAALANVLKFVRNTQAFLTSPEMRENHTLQRLRRYFCGIVERLFDGLATLKDSDRFIPSNMHLTLYRLCEEWCQLGPQSEGARQRYILMQRAAASAHVQSGSESPSDRFKAETSLLSHAAVGALAALCQKALFPPELSSGSPIERIAPEYVRPLTPTAVLERLSAILSSSHERTQSRGKKALRSILTYNMGSQELLDQSLKRAFVLTNDSDNSNSRFFEVIGEIVSKGENHGFNFSQVVCLGLSNLRHPSIDIRRQAFNILESIHHQNSGLLSMSSFEAMVGSFSFGTYIHAHRVISDFLAGEHPHPATQILAQFSSWLPQLPDSVADTNVVLLMLQSLEQWISNIELMPEDRSDWTPEAFSALYHLVSLTLRYGRSHAEQILTLWSKLVDSIHVANGHATVRFLIEQSHKVGSTIFISCAANIVSCLCQTPVGAQVFEELCSVIESDRMLPTIEHKLTFPEARELELWADLDALFAEEPRLSLGSAQFAWLFLSDAVIPRAWDMKLHLPVLLHALFTHLDYRVSYVRQRARRMLLQLLRSWAPAYDELPNRAFIAGKTSFKDVVSKFEEEASTMYWKEDEPVDETDTKMKWFTSRVLECLSPLCPSLADRWGSLTLIWGTTCAIRGIAFRSLQIFRALMPRVKQSDLARLLGRLSNIISASDENIQSFTTEILLTITSLTNVTDIDLSLVPQLYWCACASLGTTVEKEFSQALSLLEILLTKLNLDDLRTIELLMSQRPLDWEGSASLQPALLKGLRSSSTSAQTMKVLQMLSRFQDDRLIDPSGGRVRDLYTACLPWCLQAMSSDGPDDVLKQFAENIGNLATQEERPSIQKILNSFVKNHFRTRDDFLRQSVASLREHYGADHWADVVTLLLGLVLNSERWLQIQSMQILKVLFQHRETRSPVDLLGSELLMPLLRLLETDLAPQALEVLEEPMAMSGGPSAKHVLRMSMNARSLLKDRDADSVTTVFGVPEESGWSIAKADVQQESCRANVMAVFDTCSMATRPSRIDFEPEAESLALVREPSRDLGGLVKDLHDLTTFFQEKKSSTSGFSFPTPDRRLEARVAAILAKSTASETVPQTPFMRDVFRIEGLGASSDNSDTYSDSDSESDAFIFDSPSLYRNTPNGHGYH